MTVNTPGWLKMGALGAGFAAVGAGVYSLGVEPRWLEVTHPAHTLPRLTPHFDGYKVAHLSDLHLDGIGMTRSRLASVVRTVNGWQPDLVVITGDFVTFNARHFARVAAEELAHLRARDGVAAVLGNHDHWTDAAVVTEALQRGGVRVLRNSAFTIQRGDDMLHIGGVDDVVAGYADVDAVLRYIPDDGAAVLLAHEPDYADISAAAGRFDLQLSGHTHGGQVCYPFGGAVWLPSYGEKYYSGLYQIGDMLQYTTRGVGSMQPSIRFNCRPELTLHTLHSPR